VFGDDGAMDDGFGVVFIITRFNMGSLIMFYSRVLWCLVVTRWKWELWRVEGVAMASELFFQILLASLPGCSVMNLVSLVNEDFYSFSWLILVIDNGRYSRK
jgi:hypothetical protein